MLETNTIVLLIDADNAPPSAIARVMSELASHGKVTIRRAYGNWTNPHLKGWEANLHAHAIQPMLQIDLTKGKNATDIAIAIDAMDILYTKSVDTFCLMTSDSDFTPLVTRLLSEGKTVIGYGERKTPAALVNACSKFLFLDDESEKTEPVEQQTLRNDTQLLTLLRDAIRKTEQDDGWSKLSRVGAHISNHASFDARNYGYPRLSDLIDAIGDLFALQRDESSHFRVRDLKRRPLPEIG